MKNIIFILFITFTFQALQSQTVHYSYDANGNRIRRWVTVVKLLEDSSQVQKDSSTKIISNADVQHQKDVVAIYPNPTKGLLDIKITGMKPGQTSECVFYSLAGKELMRKKLSETLSRVDIGTFPPGTYIVNLILYDGRVEKWKVVKEQ